MLTGIGLRNFKAFGDEMQEAPLSKITLIYGPNSGGKSSIIQALLLLRQSLRPDYDYDWMRRLAPRGDFVDLGSFQSVLHKHDGKRNLEISVRYRNVRFNDRTLQRPAPEDPYDAAENYVRMTFRRDKADESHAEDSIFLKAVIYRITPNENNKPLLDAEALRVSYDTDFSVKILDTYGEKRSLPIETESVKEYLPTLAFPELNWNRDRLTGVLFLESPDIDSNEWYAEQERERLRRVSDMEQGMPFSLSPMPRSFALNRAVVRANHPVAKDNYLDLDKLNLSDQEICDLTPENIPFDYERHLHSINYLAPLRSAPQRIYIRASANDGTTGIQGEYSANVLARDSEGVEDAVNHWFRLFEIPYDIHARKLEESLLAGEAITIELMPLDKEGDIIDEDFTVTLADVGYGINQLLPIIIEGVASREGSILCVEQPEIHLHPRLQANIADLMIDTIADEPGKRKQWIVETHSELLITRLQRRIREGKISPDDISVLYVDPSDDNGVEGSAIIELRLGEDSYFKDHWPHGFFDDALKEEMEPVYEQINSQENVDVLDEQFAE